MSSKEKLGELLNELSEADNIIYDLRKNNNNENNNNKKKKKKESLGIFLVKKKNNNLNEKDNKLELIF